MVVACLLIVILYFCSKRIISCYETEVWLKKCEHELNEYYEELLESWPRHIPKEDIRRYEEVQFYSQRPLLVKQSGVLAVRRVPFSLQLRSCTDVSVLTPRELRYRARSKSKLRAILEEWYQTNPPPVETEITT